MTNKTHSGDVGCSEVAGTVLGKGEAEDKVYALSDLKNRPLLREHRRVHLLSKLGLYGPNRG